MSILPYLLMTGSTTPNVTENSNDNTASSQIEETTDKKPDGIKPLRPLSLKEARNLLEAGYEEIQDKCQLVVQVLDEALAHHKTHIPNDSEGLEHFTKLNDAMQLAKVLTMEVHSSIPDNIVETSPTDQQVSAFGKSLEKLMATVSKPLLEIEKPIFNKEHPHTLKIAVSFTLGALLACASGAPIAYTTTIAASAYWGKDGRELLAKFFSRPGIGAAINDKGD
ncbi:MAG: hypothetical protein AB8B60_14950 [Sulfitobacter sp.]